MGEPLLQRARVPGRRPRAAGREVCPVNDQHQGRAAGSGRDRPAAGRRLDDPPLLRACVAFAGVRRCRAAGRGGGCCGGRGGARLGGCLRAGCTPPCGMPPPRRGAFAADGQPAATAESRCSGPRSGARRCACRCAPRGRRGAPLHGVPLVPRSCTHTPWTHTNLFTSSPTRSSANHRVASTSCSSFAADGLLQDRIERGARRLSVHARGDLDQWPRSGAACSAARAKRLAAPLRSSRAICTAAPGPVNS